MQTIPIDPPYKKTREIILNQWGIEKKEIYRPFEVYRILGITNKLYEWREQKGYYPEVAKQGKVRIFTEADIERLVGITKNCKSFVKKFN